MNCRKVLKKLRMIRQYDYGKHIENAYFVKGRSFNLNNDSNKFLKLDDLKWDELVL